MSHISKLCILVIVLPLSFEPWQSFESTLLPLRCPNRYFPAWGCIFFLFPRSCVVHLLRLIVITQRLISFVVFEMAGT